MTSQSRGLSALSLEDLVNAREECGVAWDGAFAAKDIDACDSIMHTIRELSAEIARRVTA